MYGVTTYALLRKCDNPRVFGIDEYLLYLNDQWRVSVGKFDLFRKEWEEGALTSLNSPYL